jgi:hypothetical protein
MLNQQAFVLLAGDPEAWDQEMIRRCRPTDNRYPESHANVQVEQAARGRLSAELVESIRGWSVRYASNLQNRAFIFRRGTKEQAIEAGKTWANADPKNREFFAYRRLVE